MTDDSLERYAMHVQSVAREFAYPPTPKISPARTHRAPSPAARLRSRRQRLGWVAAVILVVLASLFTVPQARAALVRLIRIGAVRIFMGNPTPPATPLPETSTPEETTRMDLSQLAGETTLSEARAQAGLEIRLPTYPSDLGPPDRVFIQDQGGPVVILAWMTRDDPDRARLVLQELSSESWGVRKVQIERVTTTFVNDRPAVWASGPYILIYRNGRQVERRLVEGHSLIWEEGGVTYRLETSLNMDEAVRIAESLE